VTGEVEATIHEIMVRRPSRRFTLLDAIVLMAATAAGFAWVRSVWYFETFKGPMDWLDEIPEMVAPLLATWTVAAVVLRLLPPRPPIHRLVLQPGAAACVSVAFAFTAESLRYFLDAFARRRGVPWSRFRGVGLGTEWYGNVLVGGPYHYAIAAVWGLLLLSRRCRPEPSWIDRLGRALGLFWLLLHLWLSSVYVIGEWRGAAG
jgi:hypothetical protein